MTELDALLCRDGLAPRLRILAVATGAIAHGDWARLAAAVRAARGGAHGATRSDLEETLLQGVLFFGFPRCVSAFEVLGKEWPCATAPSGGALPKDDQAAAGRVLFDAIYDRNAPAVHALLRGFHAEFHDFVLEAAYGRVLSRPGLPPRERELIAVTALAALDQVPQLVAHGRGARRFGAEADEVREALVTALGDDPAVLEHLRRIG